MWFGATPCIVVSDAELGRAVNLRNPNRHDAMSPVMLMSAKERAWDTEGLLLTKECALRATHACPDGQELCACVHTPASTLAEGGGPASTGGAMHASMRIMCHDGHSKHCGPCDRMARCLCDSMCATQCSRAFHRSVRNAWQPAMFTESLEGYSEVMNRACDRLIRRLGKAAAKRQELDMFRVLGNLTMDVVGTASFGCRQLPALSPAKGPWPESMQVVAPCHS